MDHRIGAQLYTVHDYCQTAEGLYESMKKIRSFGYQTVQVSGIGPIPAAEVRSIADSCGLQILCTHRPLSEFFDSLPDLIDYHKTLGCDVAGLGALPAGLIGDRDGLKAFLKKISDVALELQKNGMIFSYHNHSLEFAKMDGKFVLDIIADNTPGDACQFLLDTYWIAHAGVDPVSVIRRYGDRTVAMHFKDLAVRPGTNNTRMAEVMGGNLDWDAIIAAGNASAARFAFVEHDGDFDVIDPFESLRISYLNLQTKGFC